MIVGEAPSRTSEPSRPITGSCGARLAALAGLSARAFQHTVARMNLLSAWPGASGAKGARFDLGAARRGAALVRRRAVAGRVVVLLGKRVACACAVAPVYFDEQRLRRARAFVVPHPSGVNRWYNDPTHVARMRAFMRRLVAEGGQ